MNDLQLYTLQDLKCIVSESIIREIIDCIEAHKVIRIEVFSKNILQVSRVIKKLQIHFTVSDENFRIPVDSTMDTWSSTLTTCSHKDPNSVRLVYMHHKENICEQAKLLDSNNDDLNFGLLLQYPRCCINAYLNWQKDNDDIDPITSVTNAIEYTGELQKFDFPNPFTRYFGSGLYSHFPCSLNCLGTKNIAQTSLENLQKFFPKMAQTLSGLEKSFIIFHKNKGICLWNKFIVTGKYISLERIGFYGQGKLKSIFDSIDGVIFSKNEFRLFRNSECMQVIVTKGLFIGLFTGDFNCKQTFNSTTSSENDL